MKSYLIGSDLVGATLPAAQPADTGGPYITIHVNNVPDLVRSQGGAMGGLAAALVPKTIESTVYSQMMAKLADGLKQQGVDANLKIVDNRPKGGGFPQDFLIGSAVGAAGVGVVYGIVKLVRHFTGRK